MALSRVTRTGGTTLLLLAFIACGSAQDTVANVGDPAYGDGTLGANCGTGSTDQQGCPCTAGTTVACYTGPASTRGVGSCHDGVQHCQAGQSRVNSLHVLANGGGYGYGPCEGEVLPSPADSCAAAPLPPPEDCTTPTVADFRDRVLWHTSIPGAGKFMANIGGHSIARLAGPNQSLVALELTPLFDAPYTFGGASIADNQLGYLSFTDGTAVAHHAWPGPARVFDTSGDKLGVAGLFKGTIDLGVGQWTSDPKKYTNLPNPPTAIYDFYAGSAAVPSGTVSGGDHFTISGVPEDPLPGSFPPLLDPFAAAVDPAGNVYAVGRFQGEIAIGASSVRASEPISKTDWGGFAVSFDPSGHLRWLDAIQHATASETAIDPSGKYLTTIYQTLDPKTVLELRDTSTGAVLFRHTEGVGSGGSGVLATSVDPNGNVYVLGSSSSPSLTFGPLNIGAKQNYIASFDKQGALRWSHELLDDTWPDHQTVRIAVVSNGSEVGVLLGIRHVTAVDPLVVQIGTCGRAIPRRAYPRDPETGRAVDWGSRPASFWEVKNLLAAVLDANTGEHRWSRLIDSVTTSASLAIHANGDLMVGLHNEPVTTQVDYGEGPQQNATHVFRLRGH